MSEEGGNALGSFMSGTTKFAGRIGAKVAKSDAATAAREGAVKGATEGAQKGLSDHLANKYGRPEGDEQEASKSKSLGNIENQIQLDKESMDTQVVSAPKISGPKLPSINIPKPNFKRKQGRVKSHPQLEQHRKKMREKKLDSTTVEKAKTRQVWDKDMWCVANFNFKGELPCDLEFKKGDKIKLLLRTEQEFDWWEGEVYGKKGIFPGNYVSILNIR